MATTNFVDESTVIEANWLNDVDAVTYDIFGAASTVAGARAALGLDTGDSPQFTGLTLTGELSVTSIDGSTLTLQTGNTGALTIDGSQNVSIPNGSIRVGDGSFDGGSNKLLELSSSTTGNVYQTMHTGNSNQAGILFGNQTSASKASLLYNDSDGSVEFRSFDNVAFLSADANQDVSIPNGDLVLTNDVLNSVDNDSLRIIGGTSAVSGGSILLFGGSHATEAGTVLFRTSGVNRLYIDGSDGGIYTPGVTGGSQGANTINAAAVYDDGSLLTCYVFDAAIDGQIDNNKWDSKVPNRETRNENGEVVGETVSNHEPMRKFKNRLGGDFDPLDIDSYADHWKTKRHLSAMPNEETYDPLSGKLSTGEWIQRLVETVETQAVHIDKLNQRLKAGGL